QNARCLLAAAIRGLPLLSGGSAPARPRFADVHDDVQQMGDVTGRTAQWINLPIPPAGLALLAPLDNTELTKLKTLEVFGLGGLAYLAHDPEDAGLLGAGKELSQRFARYRQLFASEPALPHAVGVEDVKRVATVADVEADRKGIEEPTEDDKGVRLRRCLKNRSERLQCRLRLLHLANNPFGWLLTSSCALGTRRATAAHESPE